jgi:hypothetical protein
MFLFYFSSIFYVCHKGKYYMMIIYMKSYNNRSTQKRRTPFTGGVGEQSLAPPSQEDSMGPPPSQEGSMPPPSQDDSMVPPVDGSMVPPPVDDSMVPPPSQDDSMVPPPSQDDSMVPPVEDSMGPPPVEDSMGPPPLVEDSMGPPPEYGAIPTGEEDSPEIKEFREKMSDPANKKDFFYLNKNISTEPNKSKAYVRQGILHFTDSMGINALRETLTSISNFFGAKGLENAVYDRLRNIALIKVGILLEENQRCYNTRLEFEREDETIFIHVYGTLYVKKE